MIKYYTNFTFDDYSKMINTIIKNNKGAKTQQDRNGIVMDNKHLLLDLNDFAEKVDYNNKSGAYNRYRNLLNDFTKWITNGIDPEHQDKNYKAKLNNEDPSDFSDSIDTNRKIYRGNTNYYEANNIKPTKAELKDKYIKQIYDNYRYYRHCKNINRFKKSRAINQTELDLKDAILSHRGLNHTGRIDNTITPDMNIKVPSFNSKRYIKYLLMTSYQELPSEDAKFDKSDAEKLLKDDEKILKAFDIGFNQYEIAKYLNVNQSTISRRLNNIIDRIYKHYKTA